MTQAWRDHPRFPEQTLLLGSHHNFRRISRVLLLRAEDGGDPQAILFVFLQWKRMMRSHERYEERKLYPYLEHRYDLDTTEVRAGHERLGEWHDKVVEAGKAEDREAFADAMNGHHEELLAHLAIEEDLVIPALLDLEPLEFEEYTQSDLRWLLENHPAATPGLPTT